MTDTKRLSHGALLELLHRFEQHEAEPSEVDELLGGFVACVSEGVAVPGPLLGWLKGVIAEYLNGEHKTLDKAFRLLRQGRGRPRADAEREVGIALAILAARVANPSLSHLDAVEDISERLGCGATKAGEAWSRRRGEALDEFLLLRPFFDETALTPEQIGRARKIALR